jgi:hypothetical protein
MEMNRLLNEILKHSEELQIKLDQETERRKAAEQKEKFWQRASFAIGIGGLILTVGGIILTLLLAVPKG